MGELRDAVDESTAALPLQPQDIALKVYALTLADSIDERNRLAEIADRALRRAEDEYGVEGVDVLDELRTLRAKLSARETLDRLGTNLHKALVELGASPRARAEGKAPKAAGAGANWRAMVVQGGAAGTLYFVETSGLPQPGTSGLYAVRVGDGLVKFGRSANVAGRLVS